MQNPDEAALGVALVLDLLLGESVTRSCRGSSMLIWTSSFQTSLSKLNVQLNAANQPSSWLLISCQPIFVCDPPSELLWIGRRNTCTVHRALTTCEHLCTIRKKKECHFPYDGGVVC